MERQETFIIFILPRSRFFGLQLRTAVVLFELRKTVKKILHCQFLFGVCVCVCKRERESVCDFSFPLWPFRTSTHGQRVRSEINLTASYIRKIHTSTLYRVRKDMIVSAIPTNSSDRKPDLIEKILPRYFRHFSY